MIKKYFKRLYHSLIFIPLCSAILFAVLALLFTQLDSDFELGNYLPVLAIVDGSVITTMLGALLGGLITLVVFSFTMMMTLYNQASSNYSPRLVTSFIGRRSYQIILGYYVGTIIFIIFVLFGVGSYGDTTPETSVLVAIILGVASLGVFVYFLNSVSQSMLVTNLIESEYNSARTTIARLDDNDNEDIEYLDYSFASYKLGYEYDVDLDAVQDFATKHELDVQVHAPGVSYYKETLVLGYTSKQLDEEQLDELLNSFTFYTPPNSALAFEANMRRIEEVGVKAMSPSTNDPGTAVLAIDYLTDLFVERSAKENSYVYDKECTNSVTMLHLPYDDLLETMYEHLFHYASADPDVRKRLLFSLSHIKKYGVQKTVVNIAEFKDKLSAQ